MSELAGTLDILVEETGVERNELVRSARFVAGLGVNWS
jgi:hypothetical protein